MILHVLIGQRKEQYEGQYALEALAAIDEFGNDDNPAYMIGEEEKARKGEEFDALAVVSIQVSSEAIRRILYPENQVLKADLVDKQQETPR